MKSFRQIFIENLDNPQPRKKRKMNATTGSDRQTQELLPDYDRVDPNYPIALKRLKTLTSGRTVIDDSTARRIIKLYDITDLRPDNPRNLGNTGITLSINNNGSYVLTK